MTETRITKKEWLDFLHLLHNKLRNGKGIKLTQMPALLEISNFMLFRFLDNDENLGIKIPDVHKFKHLYKKYATSEKIKEDISIPNMCDRNCFKLWHELYDIQNNIDCLIKKYYENEYLQRYLNSSTNRVSVFMENSNACETIQDIIYTIYKKFRGNTFDSDFFDMFGSAYEEFKTNACGNGGKHTAQHFTNVFIKQLIINELAPKHNELFYEPCAGSGGFIHTADHYVLLNEGNEKSKEFKKNIYANECNPEIFRPLVLNMLFHNIPALNIKENDSLSTENILLMKDKADVIATNYPFGMSTALSGNDDYWGILKSGKNIIKNSSGQFVIHIFNSLKKRGRAGFVSDRGIINNGSDGKVTWESKLRKFIIENSNLYKIVLLPSGAFTYTNFATCIIFLKKSKKGTNELKIYDAKFKDPKDKTSEIYIDDKPIKIFTIDDLQKNNYSLKLEEKKEEIKQGWIKLSEVVKFEKKSIHLATIGVEIGEYKFFTSSQKIKYSDKCDHVDYKIILGTGGKGSIHYEKNFSCSTDNFVIKSDKYNLKYIYYYLYVNFDIIQTGFIGNGLKHLSKEYIINIQIPDLSLEHQQEIVELLDKIFETHNIELLSQYTKDIKLFDLLIHKQYDVFADALQIIYRKIEADEMQKKFELDKKAIFNMNVNLSEYKEYKFGDACNITFGTRITKNINGVDEKEIIKYPVYGGGDISFYTNEYNRDNDTILIARFGVTPICVRYRTGKLFLNDSGMSIEPAIKSLNKIFLAYYLLYRQAKIIKFADGSGQKNMMIDKLKNKFIINIPSINDQKKILEKIEKMELEQQSYENYGKMLQEHIDQMQQIIHKLCNNDTAE